MFCLQLFGPFKVILDDTLIKLIKFRAIQILFSVVN